MLPPRLIRRMVLAPLAIVIAVAVAVLFPLLAVLTWIIGLLRRPGPAAAPALLRTGLALRRPLSTVHVPGPMDRERVRRAAADRAVSDPSLRDHALVPRPGLRGRHAR